MIEAGLIAYRSMLGAVPPLGAATDHIVLLVITCAVLLVAVIRLTFILRANGLLTRSLERRVGEGAVNLTAALRLGERDRVALANSDEYFQMLVDTASDVVFRIRLRPEPRFEYLSPSIERVTGYSAEEVIARPELAWEGIQDDLATIEEAIQHSPDESVVFRYRRRDGETIWVEVRTAAQFDDEGHVAVLQGIARDITVRKNAMSDLARLAAIVDSSGEAIVATDRPGAITVWNPAAERMFGYSRDEALGRPVSMLFPNDRGWEFDVFRGKVLGGTRAGPLETQRVRKDGSLIDVSITLSPVFDEGGSVAGASAIISDITARRTADRELRLSEERNRLILEQANAAVVGTDQNGRIAEWNRQAETVFGWTSGEVMGRSIGFLFPPRHRAVQEGALETLLATGHGPGIDEPVQFTAVRKDGAYVRVEARVSTLLVEDTRRVFAFLIDITERTRAERALRQSEQTFRRLVQEAPDAAIIVDSRRRIVLMNAAAENLFGFSFERLLGEPITTILPDDLPDPSVSAEATGRHRGNRTLTVEVRVSSIMLGSAEFASVYVRDIADRKAAEAALLRSEERFRSMMQSTPDAMLIVDREGRIVLANTEAERLYRYGPGDLVGRNIDALVPERFRSRHTRRLLALAESSAKDGLVLRRDLAARRKDGSEFPADAALSSFETEDGVFLTAMIRDSSERNRIERLLRRSEERFRAIFEDGPVGIVVMDGSGILVRANRALGEMLGYAETELLGRNLNEFAHPDDEQDGDKRARLLRGEIPTCREEQRFTRKDGRTIWANLTWSTITEDDRTFLVGLVQDVTDRREADDALRGANEELRRASEAKSVFLARMSHELRTPLSAILISAEMLTTPAYGIRSEEMLGQLGSRILQGGRHLLGLIDDLLDLTRIETGRLSVTPVPLSAAGLISELEGGLGPQARRKRIRLELPDAEGITLLADPLRIRQVFLNLIGNAIKFTEAGGSVWVGISRREGVATFSISDTGPGIAPDDLARIFEPFEQATRHADGAGLGLAIAKQIVQMHGGSIEVKSSVGKGTTFSVTVPLASGVAVAIDAAGSENEPGRPGGRILLVEDDEDIATLMMEVLRTAGFDAARAATATQAVESARSLDPDLVLLDIGLGTESGLDIVDALRDRPGAANMPILALSAFAMPDEIRRAREAGCDDYLVKPISGRDIVARIAHWLSHDDTGSTRDGQQESESDATVIALGPRPAAERFDDQPAKVQP